MTGLGTADLTIFRSVVACGTTGTVIGVVTVEVLLARLGSAWLAPTVTVLVTLPVALAATVTITVVVAVAPLARLPIVTVSVPLLFVTQPWLLVEETYVSPAGSTSVSIALVAARGPLLVVVNV